MLGDQSSGIEPAAARSSFCCDSSRPVVATTSGSFLLDAGVRDRLGRGGDGEVDHHVGRCVERSRQTDAERAGARDHAGVLAEPRMVGRIDGGDDLQFRIGGGQGDKPLTHAAGGAVDRDAKFRHDLRKPS